MNTVETAPAPKPTETRLWAVVAVSTLAMTVSYVDRQAMAALGPTVKRALSLGHEQWGYLTSAFSIAYLLGAPLAGMMVDRVGARRGLAVAVLVWSAVAGLHALVPTFAVLFLLRILLGIAESPTYPSAARCVGAVAPERSRSAALAWLFTGSSVGAAVAGPAAIALEARYDSFRVAFLGIALVGVLYAPLFWTVTGHPDVKGLVERREERKSDAHPLRDFVDLLKEPAVQRAMILVIASAPAIMLVLNWGPQLLETQLGVPQRHQARFVWAPPLAFDAGAVLFGLLASRSDRTGRSIAPLVLFAALLEGTLAFAAWTHDPIVGIALCGASMAGGGALYALAAADLFKRIGLRRAGASGGMAAAAQSLAHIVAAPIVGKVLDRTHTYHDVLLVLGAMAVPGALAFVLWPLKTPTE
jgi:ACS family hexuronate transporter-like MFS transporter